MRTFSCLLASAAAAASIAFCTASFADAPSLLTLTVENHHKLVTVKDSGGLWLFAQVVPSSSVEFSLVSLGKDLSRATLQDASGKALWSQSFPYSLADVSPEGEWSSKFHLNFAAAALALRSQETKDASKPLAPVDRIAFVVGSDDQLVSVHVVLGRHHLEMTPLKIGFAAKADGKNLLVIFPEPPAPVLAQAPVQQP